MNGYETYVNAFVETFEVDKEQAVELKYQSVWQWDSIGHMNLIAMIEESFDIAMDMDDIIDFNSFAKGIEILKKYGVEVK